MPMVVEKPVPKPLLSAETAVMTEYLLLLVTLTLPLLELACTPTVQPPSSLKALMVPY